MKILAIETSCDETSVSILSKENEKFEILSNLVSSQIDIHKEWGGVVPNLAAREHLKNILPVLGSSLEDAKVNPEDIDLLAVTQGPGLIPALLVGVDAAKTLSFTWNKPLIGIHHIEGHIYANLINNNQIEFPVLALVVSGGHTQLVRMKNHIEYEIVGQTVDDAAGEAFDKVARILNLGYPGGPEIAAKAEEYESLLDGREAFGIKFTRPMMKSKDFNFSFSGLKTAVLYTVKENEHLLSEDLFIQEVAHEFQQTVIDVLIGKTLTAAKKYNPKTILLAGGVSANKELRIQLDETLKEKSPKTKFIVPDLQYSLDNAAMIAIAAYFRWQRMSKEEKKKSSENWKDLQANANLKLS